MVEMVCHDIPQETKAAPTRLLPHTFVLKNESF